jgi:anti-sigma factor RsiW
MHSVVLDSLEEYLAGALNPARQRDVEAHLGSCANCREEVRSMQEIGELFDCLRTEEELTPSPAFYSKVIRQVQVESRPSFWSLFGLDLAFGRRMVFASLLALAVLGSYFVSSEAEYQAGPTPMSMMAQDHVGGSPDRDNMLMTLATYEP